MTVLTSTKGQSDLPRWFQTSFSVISRMRAGTFDIVLPDGRTFRAQGAEPGPHGVLEVHEPALFTRVARDGELGFAEAYMDGWWDTPDLMALMDMLLMNNDEIGRSFPGAGIVRAYERMRHWMNANSKRQAKKNISYHYDLGNQFYSTWLDETMTYSSALFDAPAEDLAAAQTRKYASMCDRIGVSEGDHVLEIGCGWGGFAEYAAAHRGARVTGLTISREQHDFARERIFRAGLNERVEIVLRDYRDETRAFDGIASIEMFEAVGEKYWPVYFDSVRDRLRPGAQATLQIITIQDRLFDGYRRGVDFIQKYIFPGGMLPSPEALRQQIERAGLDLTGSIEFGQSYSDTLRIWHDKFNDRWGEISALGFDDRFRRMWNFYLTSCAACFRSGTTDVTQISMRRPA
ncbi:class I SAM-dependent methyltransferase [Halovulum dunhuangense]|uniref:Class I SAM-dependent methyltransferase n=1 Tax=Halovulum dunhuangense TaxID=1505036 RepID=A0A849L1B1_9RHOB|nr:cyclopropane-fatty-acyl-phospholipid synthase family protein [Halovulum dunhuangense]NNU80050.1 class I SAM-dependent methyltransferase [Halovulum dunhuangense]